MFTALVLAFFFVPMFFGMMKLAMRLLGWTIRVALGLFLLPVWILVAGIGGLLLAAQVLLPIMLVVFLISLFVPEK